ncbi:MAG: ABC transporter substrate-binding protein [Pseudomonadota bacterium]
MFARNIPRIRTHCAALLALTLLGPVFSHAADAPATAEETVKITVDGIINALADDSLSEEMQLRQVKGLIYKHFDFRAMANRVLATNWSKASKPQQRKFTELFKDLLSNIYWRKISGYSNETVEYLGEKKRSEKLTTVKTLIKTNTVDIPVDYKMYDRDGVWMAYDVVVEQISLVRNYRGSFQSIVRNKGIEGLIDDLEIKVAQSSTDQ